MFLLIKKRLLEITMITDSLWYYKKRKIKSMHKDITQRKSSMRELDTCRIILMEFFFKHENETIIAGKKIKLKRSVGQKL